MYIIDNFEMVLIYLFFSERTSSATLDACIFYQMIIKGNFYCFRLPPGEQ